MKTKNIITALGILFLSSTSAFVSAQSSNNSNLPSNMDAFGKGTNVLSLGIGLGGSYTYGTSESPNLVITYDNGTFDRVGPGIISLGGLLSYKSLTSTYTSYYYGPGPGGYYYNINQTYSYFVLGFRAAYHWNFTTSRKFDPYAGFMLAYYDIGYKQTGDLPPGAVYTAAYSSYTALSLYLGARYYLSEHVAVWLELGFGYSNAALGVSYRF